MERKKTIEFLFVTNNSFPIGMALTNRLLYLAKGIQNLEYGISVLCVRPTEVWNCIYNSNSAGVYEGISYKYVITPVRSKFFLIRRLKDLISIFSSFLLILNERKDKKVMIIFFGHYPVYEFLLTLFCKLFQISVNKEESEHPSIFFRQNELGKLAYAFYIGVTYKLFSNIFVMTDNLLLFFKSKKISADKLHKLPNALYLPLFKERSSYDCNLAIPATYIAFSGTYNDKKDGILSFLEVFKIINSCKPEIKLVVIGEGNESERKSMLERIKDLELENQVYLLGRVSSPLVPSILNKARILISYRPPSLQADYGFPTKIIEYLSTGLPIATTLTGELGNYLFDKQNAFIIPSENICSASKIIIDALNNYELSIEVGRNGFKLIKNNFEAVNVAKRMVEILL
jgi:glycosyltransferase involved in cell wall biosynthesis